MSEKPPSKWEEVLDIVMDDMNWEQVHTEFVNECLDLIPETYDSDEAGDAIILTYLRDVDTIMGLLNKLLNNPGA